MRTSLRKSGLALLSCGALLGAGLATAASYHEEVDAHPGGELHVDLQSGATISVSAWDSNRVSVEATFKGRDADNVRFQVRGGGDSVRVASEFIEFRKRSNSDGHVQIRVPRQFDLRLYTSGGGIRVDGVQGRIEGETMGGELTLSGLRGSLHLETYGGEVRLSDSEVEGELKTYGGDMHLTDVVGPVEATTMGGNVILENVDAGPGGSPRDEMRISTMGGNISVPDAPHGADLETMGGNIVVESAADHVQAKTMGGNIRIEAIDGWVRASTMGGNVSVNLVGSGGDVRLSSSGGRIKLQVPEGFPMDLELNIEYTRRSDREYRIESDFPLQIDRSGGWDYSQQPPRRYVRARGTVGGGGNRVRIETTNGDIELLRSR